jgi:hypothetical protein
VPPLHPSPPPYPSAPVRLRRSTCPVDVAVDYRLQQFMAMDHLQEQEHVHLLHALGREVSQRLNVADSWPSCVCVHV